MRMRAWIVGIVLTGFAASGASGAPQKKLIHFGWDMHSPAALAKKTGALQHLPFDGLTVRAINFSNAFLFNAPSEAAVAENVEAMSKIKWGKFTDNFMYLAPGYGLGALDWFDDKAWANDGYILRNVRALARMGQAGKCKGILFDPEAGGHLLWEFEKQPRRDEKGIAAMRAMVRQRGVQVVNAIESEMPDPVFLTLFWGDSYTAVARIAEAKTPEEIDKIVAEADYGLLNDFMLGILEGAGRGTMIVDGNEHSYFTKDFAGYESARQFIHETMQGAVPKDQRSKYRAQVRAGHAIYADIHSNTREQAYASTFMTPAERAQAIEWVVYQALRSSDKYVWFYNQRCQYLNNLNVAPEMPPAIERARRKVANNEEIGFDMAPIWEKAGKEYNRVVRGSIEPLKAEIPRAAGRPKIDGRLDEAMWKKASELGPFRNIRRAVNPLQARTMAYMAYDETNLYIGTRCEDPAMDKLRVDNIEKTEGEVYGAGNLIQVAIGTDERASKYYYLTIGYDNQRWDALTERGDHPDEINGKNSSWDGKYEHATHVGKTYWSVEMAIPWKTLGRQAPEAGEKIKGNFRLCAGERPPMNLPEWSSWSDMRMSRTMEAKHFGTWEFQARKPDTRSQEPEGE